MCIYKPEIYYTGIFLIDKILDEQTADLINGLHNTYRQTRDINLLSNLLDICDEDTIKLYGENGEFYCDKKEIYINKTSFTYYHTNHDDYSIISDDPPGMQPSSRLLWSYNKEQNGIECNHTFSNWSSNNCETEWIQYIIDTILTPRSYILNGSVDCEYHCQYANKFKYIIISNNNVNEIIDYVYKGDYIKID